MGQEIVYCSGCQQRLIGSDFDKGKAFRVEHKCYCADCAKKLFQNLPAPERDAYAARLQETERRKTDSQKIPISRSLSDTGSHARLRPIADSTTGRGVPLPAKKSSSGLYIGAGIGGAAVVLLLVLAATQRGNPPPTPPAPDPPPSIEPPTARDLEAKAGLDAALAWATSHPADLDGQLERLQKAAFKADGSAVYAKAKAALEGARERAQQIVQAETAKLDAQLKGLAPDAARRLLESARPRYVSRDWDLAVHRRLEQIAAAPPVEQWTVLDLQDLRSANGATLEKKPDGSVLLSGTNPMQDVFTFTARSPLKAVTALRLEALPDPSLPSGGPGRAFNGNFVLGDFRVESGGKAVAFPGASASFEQQDWPASAAVDAHPLTGWAVSPRFGQSSDAVFHAQAPFDGSALSFSLEFLSIHELHVLGRFRLSATSTPQAAPPAPRPLESVYSMPPLVLYEDGLAPGWSNSSWGSKIDFRSTSVPPFEGNAAASVEVERNGAALCIARKTALDVSATPYLSFAIYRADESQFPAGVVLFGEGEDVKWKTLNFAALGRPSPRQWRRYVIPLSRFELPNPKVRAVVFQGYYSKFPAPPFHVDQVRFLPGPLVAEAAPAVPPHVAAYRARRIQAAQHAAARDLDAAIKLLQEGAAPPDDLKKEVEADLADFQLVRALHEEVRALLAKWPRGWNIAADVLDAAGGRKRIDEPVLRAEGQRLELRGGQVLELGRILAPSLAEIFLGRPKKLETDARAAALLCLFEGDAAAAKKFLPAAPAEKAVTVADEAEARRLYVEAEDEYAAYPTRTRALDKFAALLKEHGGTVLVRRLRASLQARLDAPRDQLFAPADLAARGLFALQRHAKGELAWTMPADADKAQRRDHVLDLEYSAPAGAEVRGWVLAGGCCAENLAFHLQGTDVEGPDPENPTVIVKCDIDGPAATPVLPTGVPFLKKTHASHSKERKETARFDWVALPPLRRAAQGTQAKLRLLGDQQGFAVAAVLLSTSRKQPPKESELPDLLAARPVAEPDLAGGARTGALFREVWRGVGGDGVDELLSNAKYKGPPDKADKIGAFESNGLGDSYGIRVRGWLVPPLSGPYVFSLISDDHAELWLSTDDGAANRQKIATRDNANGFDDWNGASKSGPVPLVRGRRYYVECFQKQGGGNEHLRVGWQLPGGATERPIPGSRLVAWTPALANRPGVSLDVPSAPPAGAPIPIVVASTGLAPGARLEIYDGAVRLGEPKGNPPQFTWAAPTTGAHLLTARAVERGGRTLVSPAVLLPVGDLFFHRALDFNGGDETIDERPWTGSTAGQGFERQDIELRPATDPARARMIRSSSALKDGAKLAVGGVPAAKYLVYATLWEPAEAPQPFDLTLNGKAVLTGHRFAATGDWARMGPWAADVADGKLELAAPRGVAQVSGLELWTAGAVPPAPTRRVNSDGVGGAGGAEFEEAFEGNPFLTGFRVTQNNGYLKSIQAFYRQGTQTIEGRTRGNPGGPHADLFAKPGYAVAGVHVKGGDRVRAFKVVFMRISGPGLLPSDRYDSDWYVGDAADTILLGGDGAPVVGIHGRCGNDLDALGLILFKP